jgi:hypothetical protein
MDEIRRRMERDHLEATARKMIIRRNEQEAGDWPQRALNEESRSRHNGRRTESYEDQDGRDKSKKMADKEELKMRKSKSTREDQERNRRWKDRQTCGKPPLQDREYILRRKLMGRLIQVRASVRLLKFKGIENVVGMKIINGKVNTLSENVDKIKSVALKSRKQLVRHVRR